MKLRDLKKSIENKTIDDSPLFLMVHDNNFVALQYVKTIADNKNLKIQYIDTLDSLGSSETDLFSSNSEDDTIYLRVMITDKLKGPLPEGIEKVTNLIVVFSSTEPETKKALDDAGLITEIPALKDWQILDYMKVVCKGMGTDRLKWLYTIAKGDVFRLDNEAQKIGVFPDDEQEEVFKELNDSEGYSDLSQLTIFNFTNAIMKKDYNSIKDILLDIDSIDIEGVGLVTILSRNVRNIIEIQMNSRATPESTGMSFKQFRAVNYSCGVFSDSKLKSMYEFLIGFDKQLKSGELDIDNDRMIDYIICELLS